MANLKDLDARANRLKKVRKLCNSILANGAYSTSEECKQIEKLNKIKENTPHAEKEQHKRLQREINLISTAWEFRRREAEIMIEELEELLGMNKNKKSDIGEMDGVST